MIKDIKTRRVLIDDDGLPEIYPTPTTKDKEWAVERYDNTTLGVNELCTWNRRYREYQEKIKSNNLSEIAEVYAKLKLIKERKDLSFGERKMLDYAYRILVKYDVLGENDGRNTTAL